MKLRIASIAFLFGSVSTGLTWLTLQPVIVRMMNTISRLAPGSVEAEGVELTRGFLPFYLALDMLLVTIICSVVLNLVVARPLRRMEQSIDQLGRLEMEIPFFSDAGPLVSRVQAALHRMAEALRQQQAITRQQLSELTAANERLTRAQTELVSAARLATVGELAAGVAHEVGNPLGGILGYLALARSRLSAPKELKEYLDRIDAEVQRIDLIVHGLLDLGRPARGTRGPVEISTLAQTCVRLVWAGPLSQVLINLLINAAHAIKGKGTIRVRGRREDQQIIVDVEDNGPGIPAEVLQRLFEPFFTTKSAGKGTGLGLAVSMHLVSSMGGQLI